jgi:hypothetical protein
VRGVLRTHGAFVLVITLIVVVWLPLKPSPIASPAPVAATAPSSTPVYDRPTPVPTIPAWALAVLAPVVTVAPTASVSATPTPAVVTVVEDALVFAAGAALYDLVAGYWPDQPGHAWRVTMCESRAEPATNTGNGHYGMWQFNLDTWYGVGGTGLPSEASAEEQTIRARALYDLRGWQPWSCK